MLFYERCTQVSPCAPSIYHMLAYEYIYDTHIKLSTPHYRFMSHLVCTRNKVHLPHRSCVVSATVSRCHSYTSGPMSDSYHWPGRCCWVSDSKPSGSSQEAFLFLALWSNWCDRPDDPSGSPSISNVRLCAAASGAFCLISELITEVCVCFLWTELREASRVARY